MAECICEANLYLQYYTNENILKDFIRNSTAFIGEQNFTHVKVSFKFLKKYKLGKASQQTKRSYNDCDNYSLEAVQCLNIFCAGHF